MSKKCDCSPKNKIKSKTYHVWYMTRGEHKGKYAYTIQHNNFEAKDWPKSLKDAVDRLLTDTLDGIMRLELVLNFKQEAEALGIENRFNVGDNRSVKQIEQSLSVLNKTLKIILTEKPKKWKDS